MFLFRMGNGRAASVMQAGKAFAGHNGLFPGDDYGIHDGSEYAGGQYLSIALPAAGTCVRSIRLPQCDGIFRNGNFDFYHWSYGRVPGLAGNHIRMAGGDGFGRTSLLIICKKRKKRMILRRMGNGKERI